jgi:hypothetical protein
MLLDNSLKKIKQFLLHKLSYSRTRPIPSSPSRDEMPYSRDGMHTDEQSMPK